MMWTYHEALKRLGQYAARPYMWASCAESFLLQVAVVLESMGDTNAAQELIAKHASDGKRSSLVKFPDVLTSEWVAVVMDDVFERAEHTQEIRRGTREYPYDAYEECVVCSKFHYTHADEKHRFVSGTPVVIK